MAEIQKEPIGVQEIPELDKSQFQGPDHFLKPNGDLPAVDGSAGTSPEDDSDFGIDSSGSNNGQSTQNNVTGDSSTDKLSTDLRTTFGTYGDIFSEILKNLESLFGAGRDLPHNVNNPSEWGSATSAFTQYLDIISSITDRMSGAESANVTSAVSQMMSYYLSLISSSIQNQFNIEQWQIQNDYNSPAKQLARLSAAGLNPLHFFDSSSTGSSTSVTASNIQAPSSFQGQAEQTDRQKAMSIASTVGKGVGAAASLASGGIGIAKGLADISNETQRVANDTAKTTSEVSKNAAQTANIEQSTKESAQRYAFNNDSFPLELKRQGAEIRNLDASTNLTKENIDNAKILRDQYRQNLVTTWGDFLRDNRLADSTIKVNNSYAQQAIESAKYIRTQKDAQQFYNDFSKATGIPKDCPAMDFFMVQSANGKLNTQQLGRIATMSMLKNGSSIQFSNNSSVGIKGIQQANSISVPFAVGPAMIGKIDECADDIVNTLCDFADFQKSGFSFFKDNWFSLDNATNKMRQFIKDKNASYMDNVTQ